jgi:hypothetical protein
LRLLPLAPSMRSWRSGSGVALAGTAMLRVPDR